MRANRREIEKFSPRDAEAYPQYNALLERVAQALEPVLSKAAPDPLPLPKERRRISVAKRLRDTGKVWELYQSLASLGADFPAAVELLTGAARPILERWFEAEVLRATLATDAIIGAFASPSMPGTAYVLLHHVMGEAGGARGVWGYVQGGMGGLADALERACQDLHVNIRRDAAVNRILVQDNRVRGVVLVDGTVLEAPVVASTVDAHWTFERFLEASELPADFAKAVSGIDYGSASMKINLALAEPPQFTCLPSAGVGPHHHGTMHIGPTMDYLERAYDDAKYGRPSAEPILEITMASSLDPTLAPPGKQVLSLFVQYAPYRLAGGQHWDDIKDAFARPVHFRVGPLCAECPRRDRTSSGVKPARSGADVRTDRRQYHARCHELEPVVRLPSGTGLGRSSHSGTRVVPLRCGQSPRWRRPGCLREKWRGRNPPRRVNRGSRFTILAQPIFAQP